MLKYRAQHKKDLADVPLAPTMGAWNLRQFKLVDHESRMPEARFHGQDEPRRFFMAIVAFTRGDTTREEKGGDDGGSGPTGGERRGLDQLSVDGVVETGERVDFN
jgi:hypothetical protein